MKIGWVALHTFYSLVPPATRASRRLLQASVAVTGWLRHRRQVLLVPSSSCPPSAYDLSLQPYKRYRFGRLDVHYYFLFSFGTHSKYLKSYLPFHYYIFCGKHPPRVRLRGSRRSLRAEIDNGFPEISVTVGWAKVTWLNYHRTMNSHVKAFPSDIAELIMIQYEENKATEK